MDYKSGVYNTVEFDGVLEITRQGYIGTVQRCLGIGSHTTDS